MSSAHVWHPLRQPKLRYSPRSWDPKPTEAQWHNLRRRIRSATTTGEAPAYTAIDLAIIAAVAVAIVIGIVNLFALENDNKPKNLLFLFLKVNCCLGSLQAFEGATVGRFLAEDDWMKIEAAALGKSYMD